MNLTSHQVRQLKKALKVTSSPLAYKDFNRFAAGLLTPLMSLLDGRGANLYITDLELKQDPFFLWHTYDHKLIPDYQSHFFKLSPVRVSVGSGMRVGEIGQYVDYSEFTKGSFYNEFLRPRRIHYMAAMAAPLPERGQVGVLGIHRQKTQPNFSRDDVEALELLFSPVQGALRTLQLAGTGKGQIERVLGSLPVGVLVFDWELRPVYRNAVLAKWLSERELTETEQRQVRRAAELVRDLFTPNLELEPESVRGVARLPRPGGGFTLRASVVPEGLFGTRPHLLCTFERESLTPLEGATLWIELGLTAREAEVVARCVTGETNLQIAKALQISPETVKHHLKQVFDKLGVERRSQLIHAIPLH